MGAKEDLLANIIRHDKSGAVQSIHDKLIEAGLKWKGPSNSETLLYLFRLDGKEVGVAAMRRGIFSFPKSFWGPRGSALHKALSNVPTHTRINVEPAISSSQHSAGQIQVSGATCEVIKELIQDVICPEAKKAGAKL